MVAVAGAVLTGGASSRMGRTKSLVEIDGVPMGRLVADVLQAAGCDPVVFIGGDARELAVLGRDVVTDEHPGGGPLGGVVTALRHLRAAPSVLVAACDLPALDAATVRSLLQAAVASPDAAAIVAHSGRPEPGLVVWNRSVLPAVEAAFDDGTRAVHRLLEQIDVVVHPVPPAAMRNVNRPEDVPGSVERGQYGQSVAIREITADELAALAASAEESGGQVELIDVREPDEWAAGHVGFARHVALGTVPDRLDAFGADGASEPTYVICKAGGRSLRACEFATANGKHVVNVTGGMMAWEQGGHPTTAGE